MPTALPPISDFVTTGQSKGTFKGALTGLRAFLAGLLGSGGGQAEALAALGVPFNGSAIKTGAYTVVGTDRGRVLKCSGTWALSFTAAATLGDGFAVEIANDGAGTITLDPNLSELIDGVTTITLAAGKSLIVYCDGGKLMTFGRGGVESIDGISGAVTAAQISAAATAGYGFTPASSGHSHSLTSAGGANSLVSSGLALKGLAAGSEIAITNNGAYLSIAYQPVGTGACIHPHSVILMADGSHKFAADIRPGDAIQTEIGTDAVIGIWESVLGNRPLIEINDKPVITPDHLLKTTTGWVAFDPQMYSDLDAGKTRAVKTLNNGMQDIAAGTVAPEDVAQLALGDTLITATGTAVVTSIVPFVLGQSMQPVLSFATAASETFFADGYAVAAL